MSEATGQSRRVLLALLLVLISCSRYGFEQIEDPCQGVECSGHGECVVTGEGQPACACHDGFHAVGLECVEGQWPCLGVDCSGHGTCGVTMEDEAVCACDPGYHNDGPTVCVPDGLCDDDQDCQDGNPCTDDSCVEGSCVNSPNNLPCDDGLYCNGADSCDGAGSCAHAGNPCPGLCDESSDGCVSCQTDGDCADQFSCTEDACTAGVCHYTPDHALCDDSEYCNGPETCDPDDPGADNDSGCLFGQNPCPETGCNHCNEAAGNCLDPAGSGCDDGLYCNGADTCDAAGACSQHAGDPCAGLLCVEADDSCQAVGDLVAFVRLAAGSAHTCGLTADGGAWCWGSDSSGQLGNGPAGDSGVPARVDTGGIGASAAFLQICAGISHSCGLAADGTAWCWGADNFGQLGNGVASDSQVPSQVDVTGMSGDRAFVQVVCGGTHSCGLTASGEVWCWGSDDAGQLGNGDGQGGTDVPGKIDASSVSGEDRFVHLAAGMLHTCSITSQGVPYCWGSDMFGQLGNGDVLSQTQRPEAVDLSPVTGEQAFLQISAGWNHSCGLTAEGVPWCWGQDTLGSLGDGGGPNDSEIPVRVVTSAFSGEQAVVSLSSGDQHCCALTADGMAYCWGINASCQLGSGSCGGGSQSPVAVDTSGISGSKTLVQIAAGLEHTCGLTADGVAYCWGNDANGELGNGAGELDQLSPGPVDGSLVTGLRTFVQLSLGAGHSCGLDARGEIYCWGKNDSGQLGTGGLPGNVLAPTAIDTSLVSGEKAWIQVECGSEFTCGLTAQGVAYCWGDDAYGQLGDGDPASSSTVPVPLDLLPGGFEQSIARLAAGDHHACALTAYGKAFCWGFNQYGQVGIGVEGTNEMSPAEVDVSGLAGERAFVQLVGGTDQTCARTATGLAYCWGYDGVGALGNGSTISGTDVPGPVDTSSISGFTGFTLLSTGGYEHFCGLTSEGIGYCWGQNMHGELGNNDYGNHSQSPTPINLQQVTGEPYFKKLAADLWHTCSLTAQGIPYCWAWDFFGQVGNGDAASDDVPYPVPVDLSGLSGDLTFTRLAAGDIHSCAITGSGVAYCWGLNGNGELGDGTTDMRHAPVPVDLSALR